MDAKLAHWDQYKMLREEIMQNIRETGRLEVAAAVAAGGAYTWLRSSPSGSVPRTAWLIIPWILLFCGFRIFDLARRTTLTAAYLERIEETAFGQDQNLPGWERYKTKTPHRRYDKLMRIITAGFWVISTILGIYFCLL